MRDDVIFDNKDFDFQLDFYPEDNLAKVGQIHGNILYTVLEMVN